MGTSRPRDTAFSTPRVSPPRRSIVKNIRSHASNRLWLASSSRDHRIFLDAARDPRGVQARILRRTLWLNRETRYGQRFRFDLVRDLSDYQRRVPTVTYDELAPDVEAIGRGERGVLTSAPVLLLEPTSGSRAPTKLIPYTGALRSEVRRAVAVWITDLFRQRPELMKGPAYWSISPRQPLETPWPSAVRVGFDDDASYLGRVTRMLVRGLMAVPGAVGRIQELETFRYVSLRFLLAEGDLRIVSVWSPTFLLLLLEPLEHWWDRLLEDIEQGTLRPPGSLPPGVRHELLDRVRPQKGRARTLRSSGPVPGDIWPMLGLISCWTDGPSARYARYLADRLPGVPMQGKGLLATEACVSIPLWRMEGSAPAITSHFLEFLPAGSSGERPLTVEAAEVGERYEVVVTTGGGLYRYRLGDVVEVVGRLHALPLLRFVGRAGRTSDRCGEKLSESFVADATGSLCSRFGLRPLFALLAPEDTETASGYVWFLELSEPEEGRVDMKALEEALDEALCESFHYLNCRRLGQLTAARIRVVGPGAAATYLRASSAAGRRLGDIKIPELELSTGWEALLCAPSGSASERGGGTGARKHLPG